MPKFAVIVEIQVSNLEVDEADVAKYVAEAVSSWHGSLPPEDPMTDVEKVVVTYAARWQQPFVRGG